MSRLGGVSRNREYVTSFSFSMAKARSEPYWTWTEPLKSSSRPDKFDRLKPNSMCRKSEVVVVRGMLGVEPRYSGLGARSSTTLLTLNIAAKNNWKMGICILKLSD